ncbi:SSI family serine proteinase inhibitor [Streptomyces sp. H27-C3]|uniref:SSI family serine proteinase inhibitor n=1 Tax=Streptomyces sp. H27-C3 TaxID=3046305 RepID=UPI0024B936A7|nr:SSI family serine proteinase inhibitor [Streptomyces sp. H27-C3]MDJ0463457.1 SSI family serine proteinase inhibitor [Streptomyces sp. H27-C3]
MLRRLVLTAAASVAALSVTAPGALAAGGPLPVPLLHAGEDLLTVTTSETGNPDADATYKLECGPAGGSHPRAQAACDRLGELAGQGKDPFAPAPEGQVCTQQYGGPASARVTGIWQGRPVDAVFGRGDGCEISHWNSMTPVLPALPVAPVLPNARA